MRSNSAQKLSRGRSGKLDTAGVLLDESLAKGQIDFARLFGNSRPVEIEIGSGKGTFLVERAGRRPEVNFLGIEYARAYCLHAADRLRRHGLANTRMIHTDADAFFAHALGPASLWRVHVYFPDPWPKRRHWRRRLIQPSFLRNVRSALKTGGQLIIVTDHMGYFEQIRGALSAVDYMLPISVPKLTGQDGELVGTNFERKYIRQNRPFYATARLKYG